MLMLRWGSVAVEIRNVCNDHHPLSHGYCCQVIAFDVGDHQRHSVQRLMRRFAARVDDPEIQIIERALICLMRSLFGFNQIYLKDSSCMRSARKLSAIYAASIKFSCCREGVSSHRRRLSDTGEDPLAAKRGVLSPV